MDTQTEELSQLVRLLKVIADESRLKIMGILADNEYSVRSLAERLRLSEPTVSHHLSKLQEMELVQMRREGTTHLYRLNSKALQEVNRTLLSKERLSELSSAESAGDADAKVLSRFLDGDRLLTIPVQPKKRLIVLKWLVAKFEEGVKYPEAELNAIIKRHHPDSAALRREMIMNGLMERAHGIYWRVPLSEPE